MSWRRFLARSRWDRERAREVESYLDFETADNIARGMTPLEARLAARRKLGNTTLIREEIYRMNSIGFAETLWQDFRHAVRVLAKSRGFTTVAVLSLELGVGANTAVFSLVHAVLLRSLPYPEPGRIVIVGARGMQYSTNLPQYQFWKENANVFSSVADYRGGGETSVLFGASQETATVLWVGNGFFRTLGSPLALGREFDAQETRSGPWSAIITDRVWRTVFNGDPNVIGRGVTIGTRPCTVSGVLRPDFWFPQQADVFLPLRPSGTIGDLGLNDYMIARLKPGIQVRQADAEMAPPAERYARVRRPEEGKRTLDIGVASMQDWYTGNVRTRIWLLFGATALLLLIACTNIAGMLLARLEQRQKEIAVRLALGSSSGRLLRQFLVENLLLCTAGGSIGVLAGSWLLRGLLVLLPFALPASAPVQIDAQVLVFSLAVAIATALMFSLAPLLTSTRMDVNETLRSAGCSIAGGSARQPARSVLVVGEVAFSVTLLVAAALLIQSLYRLHREPLGFRTSGILTFFTPPTPQRYRTPADIWNLQNALKERLSAMPGVHAVAAINVLPLTRQSNFVAEPAGRPEENIGGTEIRVVATSYFAAMGIAVARGRVFTENDGLNSQPVVLVNETLARRWWPKGNALDDRVLVGWLHGKDLTRGIEPPRQVVGIIADTKTVDLKAAARPTVYIPAAQGASWYEQGMAWVIRADRPAAIAEQVRRTVLEVEPRQRIQRMQTMDEIMASTTADSRFVAWLFGGFAALALTLTAVGVYGLLSFTVARRTNDIGIRMGLGGGRGDVLRMVLRQGLGLIAIGLAVGLGGALVMTQSLRTLLFGVKAADPFSFVVVAVALLAVGTMASYVPARRATRVDPLIALRYE